jgi:hypothetical protein
MHEKKLFCRLLQFLLLLPALYLLIQSLMTLSEQKCKFFCSPGNWLQVLVSLLTFSSTGLYVACVVKATETIARFSGNRVSFTNFEHVLHLHEVLRVLHACLLFLLFLKVLLCSQSYL